jgi:hypothetical protein
MENICLYRRRGIFDGMLVYQVNQTEDIGFLKSLCVAYWAFQELVDGEERNL